MGFASLSYLPLLAALSLSVVLILFGSGPGNSSAKVNLGPLQPIEGIRLLLALFLAGYFARRWELLRELRGATIRDVRLPSWINLPRGEYVLPVFVGVAAALMFFFFQKDLGPALFLCCVFLAVYAVARGRVGMAAIGLVLLAAGFYVGYRLRISATLADRVRMWQSPWDNAVAGGNQITHAIWAMATGGTFGTGLGLGDSRYLPAGHTDLILAAIGEELGAVGLIAVAAMFAVIAWRGFRIGRLASSDYGFFLATALTLFLILPALIMASGVIGVTPLTGVVTPFLSYGGSAMLANFAALGLLAAIHADRRPANDFEPFRAPMRYLGGVLAACAVVLVAVAVRVQVLNADELVVKPHLGVHADGGRRFEYNPRVLDLIRQMPRGTIFDRRGLPLATDDPRVLAAARPVYERLGISLAEACPDAGQALLSARRPRVSRPWRRPDRPELERDQHVLRRARCRRSSARLRRPRRLRQDARSRRPADVHDPSRLSRAGAGPAPSLRTVERGRRRVSQPAPRRASHARRRSPAPRRRHRCESGPPGAGQGRRRRARSRHRRHSRQRELSVAGGVRRSVDRRRQSGRGQRRLARSGALRCVSTRLDVQARRRNGRLARSRRRRQATRAAGCRTAASAPASTDGRVPCETTSATRIRTERSACTTGSCSRATPTSRSSPWIWDRSR